MRTTPCARATPRSGCRTPEGEITRKRLAGAASAVGVKLRFLGARHPGELQSAFATMGRERFDALFVSTDPMFTSEVGRIISWTAAARLPTTFFSRVFPDGGGLMSYGPDIGAIYRHAATYVDRILKGAKPGDLPVERPTKFELVINRKAARTLGLTLPPSVLARADEIID